MIDPDRALETILASVGPLELETAALPRSCGRYLASAIRARMDLPAFDNSAMDGFAVRAADVAGATADQPRAVRVVDTSAAGRPASKAVGPMEACRIMTGAPVPAGADAVVMRENVEESGSQVLVGDAPDPGQYIRRRAEDVRSGEPLIEAGRRIRPYEIGLFAAQGFAEVPVVRRPRVALLTSGDEIVAFNESVGPGQVRNSSAPALAADIEEWGGLAIEHGIAPDDEGAIERAMQAALETADCLFITGGVSVGDFDYTRKALSALGFKESFWRVAVRPGKPLLFGHVGKKPVFGLPGNPISSLVTAFIFARPAIERMAGRQDPGEAFPLTGVLDEPFDKPEHLRHYLFCEAAGAKPPYRLKVVLPQGSAMLRMGSRAQALAVGPIGSARLEKGMELRFRWL